MSWPFYIGLALVAVVVFVPIVSSWIEERRHRIRDRDAEASISADSSGAGAERTPSSGEKKTRRPSKSRDGGSEAHPDERPPVVSPDEGFEEDPAPYEAPGFDDVERPELLLDSGFTSPARWIGTHREHAAALVRLDESEYRLRVALEQRLPGRFVVHRRDSTPLPDELKERFIFMSTVRKFSTRFGGLREHAAFDDAFLASSDADRIDSLRAVLVPKVRKELLRASLPIVLTEEEVLYTKRDPEPDFGPSALFGCFDVMVELAEKIVAGVRDANPDLEGEADGRVLYADEKRLPDEWRARKSSEIPHSARLDFLPDPASGSLQVALADGRGGRGRGTLRIDTDRGELVLARTLDDAARRIDLGRAFRTMMSFAWDVGGRAILHLELRQQDPDLPMRWTRVGVSSRTEGFPAPVHGLPEMGRRYPWIEPDEMLELLARIRYAAEALGEPLT